MVDYRVVGIWNEGSWRWINSGSPSQSSVQLNNCFKLAMQEQHKSGFQLIKLTYPGLSADSDVVVSVDDFGEGGWATSTGGAASGRPRFWRSICVSSLFWSRSDFFTSTTVLSDFFASLKRSSKKYLGKHGLLAKLALNFLYPREAA